ncbi:hypothetical protein QUW50_02980 [Barnesiella viscericola]|uniref:hypothetical protein n=1 Tax=Barnesiella viscericola TaxID=397865 RepID=UPI0025A3327E|nr:hypothetical protein [Barnesiella viscericola]MDM8267998.1 hypothetical protein [Barnesiella viscericola]
MKNREISWTNIYSLQLLPAVVLWVLTPLLEARTTIVASMAVGVVWIVVSIFLSKLYKGCGTVGWVVGWALAVSGVLWLGLSLLHLPFVPMVLFQAPFMALLIYLFERCNIQPPFCQQCIIKRGGIWERNLLGDYTRLEAYYIIRILLFGSLIVSVVAWALFLWGIDTQSRLGRYFYLFFPAALCVALILFETIRRWLLEMAIHPSGKELNLAMNEEGNDQKKYSGIIRIIIICQGRIFLIFRQKNKNEWTSSPGLDLPLQIPYIDRSLSQTEEKQRVCQIVENELLIKDIDIRHLNSVTSEDLLQRVDHYILFLSDKDMPKMEHYPGRWYTVEEIARLNRKHRLHPLFRECYARLCTVVNAARTYRMNGERRYPIRGYKPTFTLRHLQEMNIEFDDPIWLYVSRHNEDRLLGRIDLWFQKLLRKRHSSTCCDA